VSSVDDFVAWKNAIVEIQKELNCEGGCPLGSLASELADTAPEKRSLLALGFEHWEDLIREALVRLVDQGILTREAEVDQLSDAMMAALQGGLLLAKVNRTTNALEAALQIVIDRVRSYEVR
jgi:hypothetical protein